MMDSKTLTRPLQSLKSRKIRRKLWKKRLRRSRLSTHECLRNTFSSLWSTSASGFGSTFSISWVRPWWRLQVCASWAASKTRAWPPIKIVLLWRSSFGCGLPCIFWRACSALWRSAAWKRKFAWVTCCLLSSSSMQSFSFGHRSSISRPRPLTASLRWLTYTSGLWQKFSSSTAWQLSSSAISSASSAKTPWLGSSSWKKRKRRQKKKQRHLKRLPTTRHHSWTRRRMSQKLKVCS